MRAERESLSTMGPIFGLAVRTLIVVVVVAKPVKGGGENKALRELEGHQNATVR